MQEFLDHLRNGSAPWRKCVPSFINLWGKKYINKHKQQKEIKEAKAFKRKENNYSAGYVTGCPIKLIIYKARNVELYFASILNYHIFRQHSL
jgi:hypothetical protein